MVRVTVVECAVAPPMAATVMVDVEAGMAKPLPVPHPVIVKLRHASPVSRITESSRGMPRRTRRPSAMPRATIASVIPSGASRRPGPGRVFADSAGTATVSVAVWGDVPGVTAAGEKVAVAPLGRLLALKVTALLYGLPASREASWMVYVTLVPR